MSTEDDEKKKEIEKANRAELDETTEDRRLRAAGLSDKERQELLERREEAKREAEKKASDDAAGG